MRSLPLLTFAVLSILGSAFSAEKVSPSDQASQDRSQYEDITIADYCSFLNAVASETDPYQLYDEQMATEPEHFHLTRSEDEGNYSYEPAPGYDEQPVPMSLFAIARYCNWLANDKPHAPEGLETTEDGYYNLQGVTTLEDLKAVILRKKVSEPLSKFQSHNDNSNSAEILDEVKELKEELHEVKEDHQRIIKSVAVSGGMIFMSMLALVNPPLDSVMYGLNIACYALTMIGISMEQ